MTFGSLFSGCGLMDLGLEQAGLSAAWQCEIDPAARRVLAHHWPAVPCHEDVRAVGRHNLAPVDVVAFGSPCQDVSVAGKRAGLEGQRSGLFHEAIRVVRELSPTFVLFENVPGLLSSNAGRDFAAVLGAFRDGGARDICWRVLDSQHFGVPQRRRRVFLVADFRGDRAGQILFESPCGCGHPPTRGQAGEGTAACLRGRSHGAGVNPPGRGGEDDANLVTHALTSGGHDASEDGTGRGTPIVATHDVAPCIQERDFKGADSDCTKALVIAGTLGSNGNGRGWNNDLDRAGAFIVNAAESCAFVPSGMAVRRLTPLECTRLQGAPDDWLDLSPPLADSAQYRLLGNGCTVPVVAWIARRILEATA